MVWYTCSKLKWCMWFLKATMDQWTIAFKSFVNSSPRQPGFSWQSNKYDKLLPQIVTKVLFRACARALAGNQLRHYCWKSSRRSRSSSSTGKWYSQLIVVKLNKKNRRIIFYIMSSLLIYSFLLIRFFIYPDQRVKFRISQSDWDRLID